MRHQLKKTVNTKRPNPAARQRWSCIETSTLHSRTQNTFSQTDSSATRHGAVRKIGFKLFQPYTMVSIIERVAQAKINTVLLFPQAHCMRGHAHKRNQVSAG